MTRAPGPSVRLRLTLSYAGLVVLTGALLLAVVWVFLLRYVPDAVLVTGGGPGRGPGLFVPNRSDLERAFVPRAAAALAFLLLVGLAGGWFLAGRVLAPLTRITEATRTAATGSLSHRIALPGRMDEFRELADAFDGMLARLEAHVAEQRRFAANASHELRTPLAITRTLLDVARQDPGRDPDVLVERLHEVNTRAIELTEALLLLSRADHRPPDRERVDLSLLVEEAAETLLPLAESLGVQVQTAGEVASACGSPALLLQLTANLVQNAVVHNVPGGCVWISTTARPGAVVLTVENTGEELAPELVATLTEPFQRGGRRVRTGHAGVGLGLAIVERVTAAHDGALTLTPRAGGGLRVTVRLPAAG
ncbi:sensor histidine kinase [Geodermatophilus sp. SYSU D01106]